MKNKLGPLVRVLRSAWKPQDMRAPWQWCEDHVTVDSTSPFPGKWRAAISPWVKELFEIAANRAVTLAAVQCSAQSSKTQSIINLLLYLIAEDPGPTMYILANQQDADDLVRDRFEPTMRVCKPVHDLTIRETKSSFTFTTMPLYFVGAGSTAKLQGKPMRRLFLDEVRNWDVGALPTVMKRVRAYSQLGAQTFLISTAGKEDDAVDRAFKNGDQREYHFPCPACGQLQQLKFAQLKWDTTDATRPAGQWDFDKLAATIRYECENPKCKHAFRDDPASRKLICRTGHFVRMNPAAPQHHVSFHWNALLPWWVPWRSIVEEFIEARTAIRAGDMTKMKTFVNETLGEPWKDELGIIEDFGFLEARKGTYDFGEPWPEEVARFIAADRGEAGGEHYWWVVRAVGKNGKSRLVANGRALSLTELEQARRDNNVPINNAMIDSGWKATEVYRFCLSTGWKAFKGEPEAEYFLHKVRTGAHAKDFKTVRRLWNKSLVDPFMGTRRGGSTRPLPLFRHCDDATKDLLFDFMTGLVGEWTIPKNVETEYMRQLAGERRLEEVDSHGRIRRRWKRIGANHYMDCERMIKVAELITKMIVYGDDARVPASKQETLCP